MTDSEFSRRAALKFLSGAAVTSLAPAVLHAGNSPAGNSAFDVIIVGAGMTGLNAARELLKHGYKVRVLEARARHGGRVNSQTLGSTRIEMGAEEHYLAKNNPVYNAVVDELGADAYVRAYQGDELIEIGAKTCWASTGDCESDPDIQNYWAYWSHFGKRAQHKDFSITMADDVREHYKVDKNHRAYHLYDNGIAGSIYGTALEKIGIASLGRQDWLWTLSSDIRVLNTPDIGYLDVLNTVWWNPVLEHVLLNRPVTHIDASGAHIVVTDATGDRHIAHKVIVTASIGVLQSESIGFSPALPTATVEAYNNIGMGLGMKVALRFGKQFWDDKLAYMVADGLLTVGWVPSAYKAGSEDHIIMCYPMGNNAQALSTMSRQAGGNRAGNDAIIKAMLADLDRLFDNAASPSYLDGIVQNWADDPYVCGSYSSPALATYRSAEKSMRQRLAEPIDGRLFFAGEGSNHTNPACVPGALHEGARAAGQIHALLKGVSKPPAAAG